MLHSQEVIERSVYSAILNVLIQKGLSLNPESYLPLSAANSARYEVDRAAIEATGNYIELYGSSDALSKGPKYVPRIVVYPQGFYPGDIGFEKLELESSDDGSFLVSEMPFEAIDQNIDIRLVADNINQSRLLHSIVNTALPQRGYIKPYTSNNKPFSGNIFVLLSNFFNADDSENGLLERVYQFTIKDTLLETPLVVDNPVPMVDIRLIIEASDDNTIILEEKT